MANRWVVYGFTILVFEVFVSLILTYSMIKVPFSEEL